MHARVQIYDSTTGSAARTGVTLLVSITSQHYVSDSQHHFARVICLLVNGSMRVMLALSQRRYMLPLECELPGPGR
jgi:hypothetical protein